MKSKFNGPIFIVGMSRSGTKLLRDVLNNDNDVAIPFYESHFLPYLIKELPESNFPLNTQKKNKLEKLVKDSIFYNEIKSKYNNFRDIDFQKLTSHKDIQSSIRYTMLTLANQGDKKNAKIWGDKTPNNLFHIEMLKKAFPEAKFIHIIRDPRERALSAKKAWGASIEMSAMRWEEGVKSGRKQGGHIGSDYTEITYESLISSPQEEVRRICRFLGINYSDKLLQLSEPAENYKTADNNTRSSLKIISGNVSKFKTKLTKGQIALIESVCGDLMKDIGYECLTDIEQSPKKPSTIRRIKLKLKDDFMVIVFHIKQWGLIKGFKYMLWRRKIMKISS